MLQAPGGSRICRRLPAVGLHAPRTPPVRDAPPPLPRAGVTLRLGAPLAPAVARAPPAAHVRLVARRLAALPRGHHPRLRARAARGGERTAEGGGGGGGGAFVAYRIVTRVVSITVSDRAMARASPRSHLRARNLAQDAQSGRQGFIQLVFRHLRELGVREGRGKGLHGRGVHAVLARALAQVVHDGSHILRVSGTGEGQTWGGAAQRRTKSGEERRVSSQGLLAGRGGNALASRSCSGSVRRPACGCCLRGRPPRPGAFPMAPSSRRRDQPCGAYWRINCLARAESRTRS